MFKLRKNKKGFTLVELMVVVVIIGILTAIAIPVYNSVTANAKIKTSLANQRTIDSAIQAFLAENPNDTPTIEKLVPKYLAANPNSTNSDTKPPFNEKYDVENYGTPDAPNWVCVVDWTNSDIKDDEVTQGKATLHPASETSQ